MPPWPSEVCCLGFLRAVHWPEPGIWEVEGQASQDLERPLMWTPGEMPTSQGPSPASQAPLAPHRSPLAFLKHSTHFHNFLPSLGGKLLPLLSLHPVKSDLTFQAPDIFSAIFSNTMHFGA